MDFALTAFCFLFSAVSVPGIFSERRRFCWKGSRARAGFAAHLFGTLLPLSMGLAVLAGDKLLPVDPDLFGLLACALAAALGIAGGFDTKRAVESGDIGPVKSISRGGIMLVVGLLAFIVVSVVTAALYYRH